LLLHQLVDHIAQDRANGVEALISLANIGKTGVIQQNLLDNKYCDGLAELRASFHDTETEWDNLGREKEVDDFRGVILDERSNDTKRCQAKIFEWT
jgi:hypothetical protein